MVNALDAGTRLAVGLLFVAEGLWDQESIHIHGIFVGAAWAIARACMWVCEKVIGKQERRCSEGWPVDFRWMGCWDRLPVDMDGC